LRLQVAFVALLCVLAVVVAFFNGEALTQTMDLVLPGLGVYTVWVFPAFFGLALGSWVVLIALGYLGQVFLHRRLRRLETGALQREAGAGVEAMLQELRDELTRVRQEMESLRAELRAAGSGSPPDDRHGA